MEKTCKMCRKIIYSEEKVLSLHSRYIASKDFLSVVDIEQASGYRCKSCGKEYCKDCLEKHAPGNYRGGKSCPSCGGFFEIIHDN
jgi:hypothetical protein